ncbi:MAG: cytochrome c family protein [Candidatus Eisenbacteria bacterium]
MRTIVWLAVALFFLAGATVFVTARGDEGAPAVKKEAEKKEYGFIGAQSCKTCHNIPAKGEQFAKWQSSKHAKAYQTLLNDQSKAIATGKKLTKPAHEAPECLRCHVTAWDAKAELKGAKFDPAEGIGCESCHGPGAEYKAVHMKDVPKAMTLGMIAPGEALCVSCHNPESPTFKEFKYAEALAVVAHPNPKKAK